MDWNDLRFFLTVARAKSLSAASVQLGVSVSTVSRRLEALENALQVTLFRHHREGYELTKRGRELLEPAERAEANIQSFERAASSISGNPAGLVRVDAPELLGQNIILPGLASFARANPQIHLELRTNVAPVRLTAFDNDIILRLVRPAGGDYTMRKVGEIAFGLYGSADYLGRHGAPEVAQELSKHRIIGWTDEYQYLTMMQWLNRLAMDVPLALKLTSLSAQVTAVQNGYGLAVLPAFAAREAGFTRAITSVPPLAVDLWMLVHEQAKDFPRVRAVQEEILRTLEKSAPKLSAP